MKILLLSTIIIGLLGFVLDYAVRKFETTKGNFLEKLKACKQLLNIFVYMAGGTGLYLVYKIPFLQQISNIALLCLIGATLCSIIEFGYGFLYNIKLKLNVWNYDHSYIEIGKLKIRLNIMGQVDLQHFIIWALFTPIVMNINSIISFLGG